jgi:TrmH family RNA methyltransferase
MSRTSSPARSLQGADALVARIRSPQNPRFAEAMRLAQSSRERRKSGRCVLEGEHLIAVYCDRIGAPETLVINEAASARPGIAALAKRVPSARLVVVPQALFAEIASLPPEVAALAVVATPRGEAIVDADFSLLLDDIQDPGNVGTILRSAAAAGVEQVLLSKRCAFAWSPKALRAGQGAQFATRIVEDFNLPQWSEAFRRSGGRVAATVASGGDPLWDADLSSRIALIAGNEGAGVSPAVLACADLRLTIPMPGGMESLNAAAAAAVALYECVRQRRGRQSWS